MSNTNDNLYKSSGVDVAKGDQLVQWLQDSDSSKTTNRFGSIDGGIGGFAGLFRPNFSNLKDPLLVSGTDGVGTKLLLALEQNKLDGLGVDLVAMCVNDLYCIGASPLFFLDYFATGKLNDQQFKSILQSIKVGLRQCETFLLGGETAEMPGLYEKDHFDLSGFVVGVVSSEKQLGPSRVKSGDMVLSLESSGFHSNGYSLIRKLISDHGIKDEGIIDSLLTPTRIYHQWPDVLSALPDNSVHAIANITGGGISGNLSRVIPKGLSAVIDGSRLKVPPKMIEFLRHCDLNPNDVEGVFNLGSGMITIVSAEHSELVIEELEKRSVRTTKVGYIESGEKPVTYSNPIGVQ